MSAPRTALPLTTIAAFCVYCTGCESNKNPPEQTTEEQSSVPVLDPDAHSLDSLAKHCALAKTCNEKLKCEGESVWVAGYLQWANTCAPENGCEHPKFFFYQNNEEPAHIGDVLENTFQFTAVDVAFSGWPQFFEEVWEHYTPDEEFSPPLKFKARVSQWNAIGAPCQTRLGLVLENPDDFAWLAKAVTPGQEDR